MKRFYVTLGLILTIAISVMAEIRDVQEAASIAQQFVYSQQESPMPRAAAQPLKWAYTVEQPSSVPAIYVFSRGTNKGVVLVSAEDRTRPILGYTDSGDWNEQIPTNMQVWLQHYTEEIASLQNTASVASYQQGTPVVGNLQSSTSEDGLPSKVARVSQVAASEEVVSPLLSAIQWNQGTPFNKYCPTDPVNSYARCYTGCVATAAAQVMRAWQYPEAGTGSHSYTWKYGNKTLSRDFAHTYDWTNMRANYNGSYTTDQANAVATLMYDLGVASDMEYGGASVGGSGTQTELVAIAMQTYFGYDKAMTCLRPDFMGEKAFEQAVAEELQANRPLLMSGSTENREGHCFVCDGIDENGLFHINWGWGGMQDGYFALSALDPDEQGMGGAASGAGFHVGVLAIKYIFPDKGNNATPQLGTSQMTPNKNRLKKGFQLSVKLPEIQNIGLSDWAGSAAVSVLDYEGNIKDTWIDIPV